MLDNTAQWSHGWYAQALALPSPNFGPRPLGTVVDLLVIHSISLPPQEYGGPQVLQFFTNTLSWDAHPYFQTIRGQEVSAHFFIRRSGQLWQLVSCDQRAWHAGHSSFQGRKGCNDFSVGIEMEGLEHEAFEQEQYQMLAKLCYALTQQYPIANIVGHEHIAPERKQDPGKAFDWSALHALLKQNQVHAALPFLCDA